MANRTPSDLLGLIASGAQVEVRDEEWLVRSTHPTPSDGLRVRCLGRSPLVRDTEATFFTALDHIKPLRPDETRLVADDSPGFRRSRLHLEAVLAKTPVPATETALAVSHHQLLNELGFQRRAAHKALTGLRPRLLIADAVGLGKTLEVGMILSELIRRGRGEKILVVTPRHILEQFQHELWTRFSIPLVRLDSEGIQRVRRRIPGNRNPFTYHPRAIVSIDTLKNAGRYRHHLEGIRWDAVVIDECHNLVNRGTLNNQLARVLAPRTEALLLTSATPHNGDPDSFAELIRLLDPTAVVDPAKIDASEIDHLYVRRHKQHDEVAHELGDDWAERLEPRALTVTPSPAEADLFAELADTWVHPRSGRAPASGKGHSLFPWTLLKAALSSHHALAQTVEHRRKTLAAKATADGEVGLTAHQQAEDDALVTLAHRAEAVDDTTSSKLGRLLSELADIGVGRGSKTRVVVFSERIATLDWLARTLPGELGLDRDAIAVLHGGLADVRQMDVIEDFGLAESPVRVLLTGDMAAEGVNLHRECHHLIHYDLPWSLITIEQRNGRIDRYGQRHAPDVRALLSVPEHPELSGDVRVLAKLLEREHHAHRAFGDSGSLLGLHAPELEEDALRKRLLEGTEPEDMVPESPSSEFDLMAILAGGAGDEPAPTTEPPSLFGSVTDYVDEALHLAYQDPADALDQRHDPQDPSLVSLVPPNDLVRRFRDLPQSYLDEQRVADRLRVTADPEIAELALRRALETTDSSWPEVGYLSPLHPLVDWVTDKVLVAMGRNEAPIITADVAHPTFCVQGSYANGRGQPQLVEAMAVTPGDGDGDGKSDGGTTIADLFNTLADAGVAEGMANPGETVDPGPLEAQLPAAVAACRAELARRRERRDAEIAERLDEHRDRLRRWSQGRLDLERRLGNEATERTRARQRRDVEADTDRLIDSMQTTGEPLIQVLAVLVPDRQRRGR